MQKTKKLLELYIEFESLLKDKGIDLKRYEEDADALDSNRLKMCRMFRNFLSHTNDPGFLEVTDKQLDFMQQQIDLQKEELDIVKKHMKTVKTGTCNEKDKCSDVLAKLIKLKIDEIVVRTTDGGYGIANIYDIAERVLKSKTIKMANVRLKRNYIITDPYYEVKDVPEGMIVICTKDGTAKGRLMGVMYY